MGQFTYRNYAKINDSLINRLCPWANSFLTIWKNMYTRIFLMNYEQSKSIDQFFPLIIMCMSIFSTVLILKCIFPINPRVRLLVGWLVCPSVKSPTRAGSYTSMHLSEHLLLIARFTNWNTYTFVSTTTWITTIKTLIL